jgi:hypothetical protein
VETAFYCTYFKSGVENLLPLHVFIFCKRLSLLLNFIIFDNTVHRGLSDVSHPNRQLREPPTVKNIDSVL